MKRTRKLLAMFMMFIMVMGEMGSTVFAAGIDKVSDDLILSDELTEAVSEPSEALADVETETADAVSEIADVLKEDGESITDSETLELVDADDESAEDAAGRDGAGGITLYVNGVELSEAGMAGKYIGTDDNVYNTLAEIPSSVKGYLMYKDNVLTMKDYEIVGDRKIGTGSTYSTAEIPSVNIEEKGLAGDLTILVIGDCKISPKGRNDKTCRAIDTQGNLSIESTNESSSILPKRKKGTLTIESTPVSGTSWDCSISCGGNLTLSSPSEIIHPLEYKGLTLECKMGGKVEGGLYTEPGEIYSHGNITINDARVTVNTVKTVNMGITADGSFSIPNGIVNVTCDIASDDSKSYFGIYAIGDISIGKSARVTSNCNPADTYISKCYGVYSDAGNITVSGELNAYAQDEGPENYGVFADSGKIVLDHAYITYPEGGSISEDGRTIVKSDKKPATKVEIAQGDLYDLWIGSTRVTSNNCSDLSSAVEGTGATAVYDPETNTLTLNNVTGVKGVDPKKSAKIYAEIPFNLRGKGNTIENTSTNMEGLYVSASGGNVNIQGEFTFRGDGNGIYTPGCLLEVDGSDTKLIGVSKSNKQCGIYARGGFTLIDGSVIAEGKTGLVSLDKPIAVMGGKLVATGSEYAVSANNSTINIDASMEITEPEGGVVGKIGNNSVVMSGDHAATNVKIEKKPTFTVKFNLNGKPGTAPADENVISGLTVSKPYPDPATDEFSFTGWYTEAECTNLYDFDTPVTANITLYAGWREKAKFTVTFDMNGKEATDVPAPQTVIAGNKATKPTTDPKADGFKFMGWFKDAACTAVFDFDGVIIGDTTIYAKWIDKDAELFTVTFNLNGHPEATPAPAAQSVEKDGKATRPATPEVYGFVCVGWYKEAACENKYDFDTPVTANITLYAKWIEGVPSGSSIWNLYEDTMVHTFFVNGIKVTGSYENKNAKSKKYYDASISGTSYGGSVITVMLTGNGDRKKAAAAANSLLEFNLGPDGVIEYAL
ncbi:MAG: InlB B-repeat-containing protein, partial [Lachnospiraceae bacterium]|nr:InlB B-repeat-containing protein [Lachnospiraceae bacterium]